MGLEKRRTSDALLIVAVLVTLGAPSAARANVKIWNWTTGTGFEVGAVCRCNNVIYKCILAHTALPGNTPPNGTYWTAMNAWATGNNYAVGNLVYYGNPAHIYRCNQAHQSTEANPPGNDPPWHMPFPKDPAVKTGGQGPSGNDYVDYYMLYADDDALPYRSGGQDDSYASRCCVIQTTNPNFDATKNHITTPAAWNSATGYPIGRQVTNGGITYQAIKASTNVQPPNVLWWSAGAVQTVEHITTRDEYGDGGGVPTLSGLA